jgi:hypothetical protein
MTDENKEVKHPADGTLSEPIQGEPGSDDLLYATEGVTEEEVVSDAKAEAREQAAEDITLQRYSGYPAPDDEPGTTRTSVDRPPPDDQEHPEFDPLPVEVL